MMEALGDSGWPPPAAAAVMKPRLPGHPGPASGRVLKTQQQGCSRHLAPEFRRKGPPPHCGPVAACGPSEGESCGPTPTPSQGSTLL